MLASKIISIDETNFKDNGLPYGKDYYGYVITTEAGKIYIGINDYRYCCEDYGA